MAKQSPFTSSYVVTPGAGSVQLEPRNFNIENPQYPLDDPSVWSDGAMSASGRRVSPEKALHLPAFYQAITRISGDIARCPLELYEENNGAYKALVDDPLFRLTAIQPNREMDAFKFWQRVLVQKLVWQNAYIYVAMNGAGQPAELLPLLSDRTRPKRTNGKLEFETETDGEKIPLPASRVIHLEGIGFDNLLGLELCKLMRDAFGLALAQMDFASAVYKKGGRRGGVLELPASMPKAAVDRLEEGFRKKYDEEGQWFTTVILRDNAKFHEAQMTLRDSQSIEGREESVRDVARACNIRPGHLGVETSGVYGNKSDDTRDYLDMTLRPHMAGISAQLRIKLLPLERQGRHCFDHNTDDLLQMSVKDAFEAYGSGIQGAIITSNEARGKLGFAPHPEGNKLGSPHTTSNKPGKPGATPPGKKPAADPAADEQDDDEEYNSLTAALHQLLSTHVSDVLTVIGEKARRSAKSGAKFVDWVDNKLPGERSKLHRAIAPIAVCFAANSEADADELAAELVARAFDPFQKAMREIAETASEAELKTALSEYFQNWEPKPCPPSVTSTAKTPISKAA